MEMSFQLRERTILLVSPLSSVAQSLIMGLTQLGADVVIVHKDVSGMTRYCNQINDSREINPKFGRALAVQADFTQKDSIRDAIGKAAHSFGSIDIYIDAQMTEGKTPVIFGDEDEGFEALAHQNLITPVMLTKSVLNFLKARKRGRILYLMSESSVRGSAQDTLGAAARTGLIGYAKCLSRQVVDFNITVNCLALGATEEYLLGHFTECSSIKEAQEKMRQVDPILKITEPDKVTATVAYLVSNMGSAVNGQLISLV